MSDVAATAATANAVAAHGGGIRHPLLAHARVLLWGLYQVHLESVIEHLLPCMSCSSSSSVKPIFCL